MIRSILVCLVAGWLTAAVASADGDRPEEPVTAGEESASAGRWRLFPRGHLYPRYLADPHAPTAAAEFQSVSTVGIEQAGDARQHVKLGGIFPLARREPKRPGGRRWQVRLEGGLDAVFDRENRTDNIGWDGNYGLSLTSDREEGGWAYKVGTFHISAHVGDEWIERTGRTLVGYRREELMAAVARVWGPGRRAYLEGGWAYDRLNEERQKPARVQAGFEHQGKRRFFGDSTGWYAAIDLSAWEERDWRLDVGAQLGLVTNPHGRTWRIGLQYWDGRVPLGEFFAETEPYLALGLWTDL